MTTATLERPTAPKPPAAPGEWRLRLEAAVPIFENPGKYISLPDRPADVDNLPINELLELRNLVAQRPTIEEQLRLLALPQLARVTLPDDPVEYAAKEYASRCASPLRREQVQEVLFDWLKALDEQIVAALDRGEKHENLIRVRDFGNGTLNDGLATLQLTSDSPIYVVGYLHALPEYHPLRDAVELPLRHGDGKRPVLVLGPAVGGRNLAAWNDEPTFFGVPVARKFYLLDRCKRLTWQFARCQEDALANKLPYQLTDEEIARMRLTEAERGKMPPKPAPVVPPPPKADVPWAIKCRQGLETLPTISRIFLNQPSAGIPLGDLVAVRALFCGVRQDGTDIEQDAAPLTLAARGFASRCAGGRRSDTIRELIHPLLNRLDAVIDERRAEGAVWSALRCQTLEADLAAMQDELAALRAEVAELRGTSK
jgi:hypothetical protein